MEGHFNQNKKMIHEEDLEKIEHQFTDNLVKGSKLARLNDINLSKFKREIMKGLLTINNEDQWTFDYESYLCVLSSGNFVTPTEWGKEYYLERWKN